MANEVILLGCGDVGPIHEPMERYSELVRDALAGADIRFAQVERTYSERGESPRWRATTRWIGAPRHYSIRSTCCAARGSRSSAGATWRRRGSRRSSNAKGCVSRCSLIVPFCTKAAGADLILGHHAHVPKAIEVREGKTCFYSLSNFIMSSEAKVTGGAAEFQRNYGVPLDPEYPNMPYGIDAKRSLIAKTVISRDAIRTSFLPVIIDPQLRPEIICASDPRFDGMVQYMEWASEGFAHRFAVDGDEIAISG
jgi:hypothetical protein